MGARANGATSMGAPISLPVGFEGMSKLSGEGCPRIGITMGAGEYSLEKLMAISACSLPPTSRASCSGGEEA